MSEVVTKKFFAIVPPGFEKLAIRELEARGYFSPAPENVLRGGIELELPIPSGYELNRESHLAVRVLERLEKWRCRDFPKLFNKTQSVTWEKWVTGEFEVEVSAHKSRLMNKKRIAETVEKGVKARLKKHPAKKSLAKTPQPPLKIFVRFNNDEVEMSLDTSGDALFKRGYKTLEDAVAPLRENLAAAVFWSLYEKSGRPQNVTLIDPTCGSATLLTEAKSFFGPKPARDYAFEQWSKTATVKPQSVVSMPKPTVTAVGFDRDASTLKQAVQNGENLGVKIHLSQADFLKVETKDVLAFIDAFESKDSPAFRIGIANPPYGERIQWPVPPKQFYAGLISFFKASGCQVYGFIVPRQKARDLPQAQLKVDFENGGIPVSLMVYGSSRNH